MGAGQAGRRIGAGAGAREAAAVLAPESAEPRHARARRRRLRRRRRRVRVRSHPRPRSLRRRQRRGPARDLREPVPRGHGHVDVEGRAPGDAGGLRAPLAPRRPAGPPRHEGDGLRGRAPPRRERLRREAPRRREVPLRDPPRARGATRVRVPPLAAALQAAPRPTGVGRRARGLARPRRRRRRRRGRAPAADPRGLLPPAGGLREARAAPLRGGRPHGPRAVHDDARDGLGRRRDREARPRGAAAHRPGALEARPELGRGIDEPGEARLRRARPGPVEDRQRVDATLDQRRPLPDGHRALPPLLRAPHRRGDGQRHAVLAPGGHARRAGREAQGPAPRRGPGVAPPETTPARG